MFKTAFDPETNGFAFTNSWGFNEADRQVLRDTFAKYLTWGGILGTATFGLAGALFVPFAILAIRKKTEDVLSQDRYGLCGGMSFAALDYFRSAMPAPRGEHSSDHPGPENPLRSYIWRRQLESLASDLPRFFAWLISLNYVPSFWPFGGGAERLLARTEREWAKLKTSLDSGNPVPLGLVRDTAYVFDNHQVLATGYEASGSQATIYLYDPNYPDRESTISLEFDERLRSVVENRVASPALRGFFCEAYSFTRPAEAVG